MESFACRKLSTFETKVQLADFACASSTSKTHSTNETGESSQEYPVSHADDGRGYTFRLL